MPTMRTISTMTMARRAAAGIAAMLVASGGTLLAIDSGALASTAKSSAVRHGRASHRQSGLAVFSHPLGVRRARTASADGVQAPSGAVLAAVSSKNEIYAWQPTAAEETMPMRTADHGNSICIVEVLSNGPESIACGPSAKIEERGLIGINMPSKDAPNLYAAALVPNGVTSVTVTDNNGATYAVPVSNNAVIVEDPNLAAVSYGLPNGGVNNATVSEATASRQ